MATSGGRSTPKKQGRDFEGRLRSHTDSAIHGVVSSFDNIDLESSSHKAKLYELFALIEKEFDVLHAENTALRLQINAPNSERTGMDTPLTNTETYTPSELSLKASSKKAGAQMRQKWKTAFGRPPGKLVNSLKVSAGVDRSKYRFVRYFEGHQDGVWHVTATSNLVTALVGSASADQTAKIWSADLGQCLLNYTGHSGSVNSITFHPDSTSYNTDQLMVLTASGDKSAHIWKTVTQTQVNTGVGGSSEDDVETGSVKGEIENEDPQLSTVPVVLRQPLVRLTGHNGVVISSEWLVGGDQVLTASWDRTANIYDAENGKILNTLTGHDQELTHCNAHSTQKLVATASKDYTFRLWDFREAIQSVAVFQGHNDSVTSVVFSSTHHIISGSDDRTVKVWDLRNMRSPISAMRLSSPVNRLAVSHKFNLIAIPLDSRHICIYDFQGIRITRLPRANGRSHRRMITSSAWLSDNTTNNLFTSSFDKQIIGWKVPLGKS